MVFCYQTTRLDGEQGSRVRGYFVGESFFRFFGQVCSNDEYVTGYYFEEIPRDAKFCGVSVSPESRGLIFYYEHETFDFVLSGERPPTFYPESYTAQTVRGREMRSGKVEI